jgi:hypothetical protein
MKGNNIISTKSPETYYAERVVILKDWDSTYKKAILSKEPRYFEIELAPIKLMPFEVSMGIYIVTGNISQIKNLQNHNETSKYLSEIEENFFQDREISRDIFLCNRFSKHWDAFFKCVQEAADTHKTILVTLLRSETSERFFILTATLS